MATPRIPVNQQNALPLLTLDEGSNPGDVVVLGNNVVRYWSPSALGINAAPPAVLAAPDGYGNRGFLSSIIDMTGMRSLTVQILRNVTAAGGSETTPILSIYLEMAFDPLSGGSQTFPTTHSTGGSLRDQSLILIDSAQFDASSAFPDNQVANRGRAFDVARGAGSGAQSGLYGPLGPRCRLFLDWNTALVPGSQFWSAAIFASS